MLYRELIFAAGKGILIIFVHMKAQEIENFRPLNNRVLIKLDRIINDTVKIAQINLQVDTDFDPQEYVVTNGTVIQPPTHFVYRPRNPVSGLTWLPSEIVVRSGDRVCFDYHSAMQCLGSKVNPLYDGVDEYYYADDTEDYYLLLPYWALFYVDRGGEDITTLNGYVMIERDQDDNTSKTLEKLGLIPFTTTPTYKNSGTVKYPMTHNISYDGVESGYRVDEIRQGMRVIWKKRQDFKFTTRYSGDQRFAEFVLVQDRHIKGSLE